MFSTLEMKEKTWSTDRSIKMLASAIILRPPSARPYRTPPRASCTVTQQTSAGACAPLK
jgi:hypothetical protein